MELKEISNPFNMHHLGLESGNLACIHGEFRKQKFRNMKSEE